MRPKNVIIVIFVAVVIGAGAAGLYFGEKYYFGPMREKQVQIDNLKEIVANLTARKRVAQVAVVKQEKNPLRTTFVFLEIDEKNQPAGPAKTFTIDGDIAYFDSLVIRFTNEFLPLKDADLSTFDRKDLAARLQQKGALIFFRRVFGEKQKPEDGFPLDTPGQKPAPYRTAGTAYGTPANPYEQQLWEEFWTLATDPKVAKERGVDVAYGEAPFTKLVSGKYYVLERDLQGDLIIRVLEIPPVLQTQPAAN